MMLIVVTDTDGRKHSLSYKKREIVLFLSSRCFRLIYCLIISFFYRCAKILKKICRC